MHRVSRSTPVRSVERSETETLRHRAVQRQVIAALTAVIFLTVVSNGAQAGRATTPACPNAIPCTSSVGPGGNVTFSGFNVLVTPGGNPVTVSYDGMALTTSVGGSFGLSVDAPPAARCQPVNGLQNRVRCLAPQGEIRVTVTPPNPGVGMCSAATLPMGWNLVSGLVAAEVTTNVGPLYLYDAHDGAYRSPNSAGDFAPTAGYWVLFDEPTDVSVGCPAPPEFRPTSPASVSIPVASGWTMIGNGLPLANTAQISCADLTDIYDPQSGYESTTTLAPGQGAWVYSIAGGMVVLTAFSGGP